MDEQRLQAYLQLMKALLDCPSGEEPKILAANPDLLDEGLVRTVAQLAEIQEARGNGKIANFLRQIAVDIGAMVMSQMAEGGNPEALNALQELVAQLSGKMGDSSTPPPLSGVAGAGEEQGMTEDARQARLRFLMEVLQATLDSKGDRRVVYPLLQRNLDNLDENLVWVLQAWAAQTLPREEPRRARSMAADIVNFSNRIKDFPLGNRGVNLEIAIAGYKVVASVFPRETYPVEWAMTQNNLGTAYCYRIRGERAENIELAIECHQQALTEYTRERFPEDWAMTQNNLGLAYRNRIRWEKAENIEQAIDCYQQALLEYTHQRFPEQWAKTQNNLGFAYSDRIRGERAENIEQAIYCYQQALLERTRQRFPEDWAITQNNLGNAYSNRIRGERAKNIKLAIHYYKQALQEDTCERFPQNHAETSFNLGLAYQDGRQFENAYTAFKSSIDTVESLRGEIITGSGREEDKQKLAEEWNELYRGMVEVCLKLDNDTKAIEYVERSKTRNLVELILSRDIHSLFPPEVAQQLEQLRDEIASGQYQLQNATAENPTALAQHLQQLRQQRNELQDRYLPIGDGFQFDRFRNTLDDCTAVVQWYITGDKLLTFIFTSETQSPIVVTSEPKDLKKLENWANGYFRAYSTHKSHWQRRLTTRLHLLANILHIDGILDKIPTACDRLILIPHRALHLFPLHALPVQGESSLFARFPRGVSYAPSCQLLQLVQKRERPNFTDLFAVQNPTKDLDYADLEVAVIKTYFESADVLEQSKATKEAISKDSLNAAHCVHFSCHGYFNFANPRKSALIPAGADLNPPPATLDSEYHLPLSDGTVLDLNKCLTLDTIFTLNLAQCRLLTLSACETGLIDFDNTSDEYIGLPSGFLYAGSPSVVCTLWTVDQVSTAFLLIKFYENLRETLRNYQELQEGDVALALNQAQIWLRNLTREEGQKMLEKILPQIEEIFQGKPRSKKAFLTGASKRINSPSPHPFASPFDWAAFTAAGI
ncbi:CHAT domain-containing protein [Kamptonema formosum]|uniref:CHAT domain-containing protein n=1 Tax=Kamptonema formosum TaxID=331992 RepID=UPI00034DCCAE|nr:CHAT domain-containing protein [Oscillatoria sp. PCC 10802]